MVSSIWRCGGCLLGFGFGAVWTTAGLGSALIALVCSAVAYALVVAVQRRQLSRRTEAFFAEKERRRPRRPAPVAQPGR